MTTFNWRVLEPNTLRSYEQAARDFETVTGRPVHDADIVSVSMWRKSMEARRYTINTIRTRLSAVAVIAGVKIELPKKTPAGRQPSILSREQIKAVMSAVTDQADRMMLVQLLTLGMHARTIPNDLTFGAHFAGATVEPDAQKITRKLRSYARKAGLNEKQISLRVWCQTGRRLVEVCTANELVDLIGHREDPSQVSWRPLHGIGRRSRSLSV